MTGSFGTFRQSALRNGIPDVVAFDVGMSFIAGLQDTCRAHADQFPHRLEREAVVEKNAKAFIREDLGDGRASRRGRSVSQAGLKGRA